MPVSMFAVHKKFVGLSTDIKPYIGQQADGVTTTVATDIPVGSTFLEMDTGSMARWDGVAWKYPLPANYDHQELLDDISALKLELSALRLGMIEAGACKDVALAELMAT